MARRGDVTLRRYVGKRGIHKRYAHGDMGWHRYYYADDGVITTVQKEQ